MDEPGYLQHVTFRTHDSIPRKVIEGWKEELGLDDALPSNDPNRLRLYRRIDRYLDAGHGACCLRQAEIAQLVQTTLLHFAGIRYVLLAWCIMPNHVHVLIRTNRGSEKGNGERLAEILHSWKSYTATAANRILNRRGPFWMREYHDRFVRNAAHLHACMCYIHENPVKAGLCQHAEDWQWSSAKSLGKEAGG